jgi:spermidine synthase
LLPALSLLFFGSGACALIYQVLWLRLLGLVFGVTIYAASTVWASFMAGLAFGSLAAGVLADRVRRPLMWFGGCELLIGATALATPLALERLQQAYVRLYPSLAGSLPLLTLVRFAFSFVVLLVPAVLMGATLPLVVKSSVFRSDRLGRHVGMLYATNTAGAIVGTLSAGLYLIPQRGIHGTFVAAATINLLVGICAIVAGRVAAPPPALTVSAGGHAPIARQAQMAPAGSGPGGAARDEGRRRLVLLVFGISGFTALALEVVWFRTLTLFLRPTVYGFALMLAAVLAGIAVGSYAVTPILDRRGRWISVLATLEFAISLAALFSFGLLVNLNASADRMRPLLTSIVDEWLVYPLVGSVQAIFPTAILMGAAFPIGLRLWSASGGDAGPTRARRIGTFYAVNVAGSIAGSIVAGFFLLPNLGSRWSIILLAAMSFGCGLGLLARSEWRRTTRLFAGAAMSVVFVLGVWRSPDPFDQFVALRYPRQRIVWREEGVEATVVVHARNDELTLSVNGNHQASTGRAMVHGHRMIGHLPMLLHWDPRSALVIGLGGGATAGAVSVHDNVEVDVVELAGAVTRGARFFSSINDSLLSRSNVHLRVDDGRNYLMLTPQRYDVVTADVIHPIYAGSGNLYSQEYFRLIRRVLKPGGLAIQWVAGTDAEYKLIARTFLSVFPDATAWGDGTLLVGGTGPLRLSRRRFEQNVQLPGTLQGARDLGAPTFDQLLGLFRAGSEELRTFVGPGLILTDDRPLVEYFLSLPRDRDVDLSPLHGDVRRYVVDD